LVLEQLLELIRLNETFTSACIVFGSDKIRLPLILYRWVLEELLEATRIAGNPSSLLFLGVAKHVSTSRDNFQDEISFPMIFAVRWLYKIGSGAVFETTRINETFSSGLLFLEVAEYVSMSRDDFQDEIRLSLTFIARWSHKMGPEAVA
jgi:hypothetical protein